LGHMMPHDVNVDAAHHWPAGVQPFVTTRDFSAAVAVGDSLCSMLNDSVTL
jgi:hypothetical protein